jgi:hypothetical protein
MDVELVEAWVVAVTSELDLELQLVTLDGKPTDGTGRADARPAPGTVRPSGRKFPRLDDCSRLDAWISQWRIVGSATADRIAQALQANGLAG